MNFGHNLEFPIIVHYPKGSRYGTVHIWSKRPVGLGLEIAEKGGSKASCGQLPNPAQTAWNNRDVLVKKLPNFITKKPTILLKK